MSSELKAIQTIPTPRTRTSLAADLARLGLRAGMTVMVHSSLSALGWVCGGAVAVVQALMDVVTPEGTLVMPTHSGEYSDPSYWGNPPVPEDWWPVIRETMPLFDPALTQSRGMGRIPEVFRTVPGALRSRHPALSFAAWGRHAEFVTTGHSLEFSLGESSPLARVYDLDGWVLLLGVGHRNNTSLHLAEYRAPGRPRTVQGAPWLVDGRRVWQAYEDVDLDAEVFGDLGADYERLHPVTTGLVGSAETRLLRQRPIVDFAVEWLTAKA